MFAVGNVSFILVVTSAESFLTLITVIIDPNMYRCICCYGCRIIS